MLHKNENQAQLTRISAIVAMAQNGVIGYQQQLPWKLPKDLKRFQTLTQGFPILMGSKTFQSIGKVLPGRLHLVLSKKPQQYLNASSHHPVQFFQSFENAIQSVRGRFSEVFIIGGEKVYQQAIPHVQRLYMTLIHQNYLGDTFFPPFPYAEFEKVSQEDFFEPFPFSFLVWDRKKDKIKPV